MCEAAIQSVCRFRRRRKGNASSDCRGTSLQSTLTCALCYLQSEHLTWDAGSLPPSHPQLASIGEQRGTPGIRTGGASSLFCGLCAGVVGAQARCVENSPILTPNRRVSRDGTSRRRAESAAPLGQRAWRAVYATSGKHVRRPLGERTNSLSTPSSPLHPDVCTAQCSHNKTHCRAFGDDAVFGLVRSLIAG